MDGLSELQQGNPGARLGAAALERCTFPRATGRQSRRSDGGGREWRWPIGFSRRDVSEHRTGIHRDGTD